MFVDSEKASKMKLFSIARGDRGTKKMKELVLQKSWNKNVGSDEKVIKFHPKERVRAYISVCNMNKKAAIKSQVNFSNRFLLFRLNIVD